MGTDIINTALQLLKNESISNYAIAKATGISKPTIAKYRSGETVPNEVYAEKIVNYITNANETGETQKDNSITNSTNTQEMDPLAMALDYISTLKQQLVEKDELIRRLTAGQQTAADEVLSRRVGAVEKKQDELTESL
jgi:transcriptional regulator with XRE-family HTH domain